MKSLRRIYFGLTAVSLALAVVTGYYAVTLEWAERAPFDVLGILFVLSSLPRLVAIGATAFLIGLAGFSASRGVRTPVRATDEAYELWKAVAPENLPPSEPESSDSQSSSPGSAPGE